MNRKNGLTTIGLVVILLLISMPVPTSAPGVSVNLTHKTTLAQSSLEIDSDLTLTQDLWDTSIIVTSDKVVINGNGYTLHGSGSGVAVLAENREKVTIENLGVEGWGVGILFIDCSKTRTVDSTVSTCVYGIALVRSEKSEVKRNTVQDCDWIGFYLGDSSDNQIADNIALQNTEMGFGLEGICVKNRYVGNIATQSSHGIWMGPDSHENVFTLNEISYCIDGIHLSGSISNKLIGNTINSCGNGILTMGASENWLEGNTISWPLGITEYPLGDDHIYPNFGIYIFEGGYNTLFQNDVFNLPAGHWLGWTEHNTLTENTATNCFQEGFRILDSHFNTLEHNTATFTTDLPEFYTSGFHIFGFLPEQGIQASGNNLLLENTATNMVYGYLLGLGTYSTDFIGNDATNNRMGFGTDEGFDNHFIENEVNHNSLGGFYVTTDDCTFLGNILTDNGWLNSGYGFGLVNAHGNEFEDNTVIGSYLPFTFQGDSSDNYAFENDVENSAICLVFINTVSNNYLYHNNFIVDTVRFALQSPEIMSQNYMYNPLLNEGNYWSDWDGTTIPWHFDLYPFMTMNGWLY
ncbi:MAG: NosD domain-containing protein [Promethearchaeota archaeon]